MSQKIGRFDKKVSQRRRFSEGNWKSVPTYNVCQLTTVYPSEIENKLYVSPPKMCSVIYLSYDPN